jgi:hypothetical protein
MSIYEYELAKQLFDYDPIIGHLRWKVSRQGNNGIGTIPGSIQKNGYRAVSFNGKLKYEHRIIFLWHNGRWPKEGYDLDHINRIRDDNRIENLQEATRRQNLRNCQRRITNSSGHEGVRWAKKEKRWVVEVKGHFTSYEMACSAQEKLKHELDALFIS